MADAETRERIVKRRWAEPGSGHDQIVRWSKILLPGAVGVLIYACFRDRLRELVDG